MKKLLLIAAVAVFGLSNVNAQSDSGDFTLAPQVGLNLSNYSSSEKLNNKVRTSFNVGAIVEYYFNDRWSLRSGLIYDSKGTKVTDSGDEYIDKLNYIAIPMHANWHFGSNRNWFLNFGPTLGILASAKSDTPDGEINIKNQVNSFDLGLGAGIGYKFDVAENTQFYLQYQGYNGFISLSDSFDFSLFNATSAFNIGAIFKI